jgi:hypothetical protein
MDEIRALSSRGMVRTADARSAGVDPRALRAAHANDRLVRVRRDAYVDADEWAGSGSATRYGLRVKAASARLHEPVFSHYSAAVMWELPLIGTWPTDVHVRHARSGGGRSWPGVVRHGSDVEVPVVVRDGVVLTDVAATVVDIARVAPFATALAMADHALRVGLSTNDELDAAAARLGSRRGSRSARRVARYADGLAGSPGESLSRARMIELAAPMPELQREFRDSRGFVARTDFYWRALRIVGEFDGRLKYRIGGLPAGPSVEERVWLEKVREDRLRATGVGVTRWTWETAMSPRRFAAHLRAAGIL